jgi:hypothetical protein
LVPGRIIFLVPCRTLWGKGYTWNPVGFYLEPERVLQMVLLWGQIKKPFRFWITPFFEESRNL